MPERIKVNSNGDLKPKKDAMVHESKWHGKDCPANHSTTRPYQVGYSQVNRLLIDINGAK
jgi:hypothetical protein